MKKKVGFWNWYHNCIYQGAEEKHWELPVFSLILFLQFSTIWDVTRIHSIIIVLVLFLFFSFLHIG